MPPSIGQIPATRQARCVHAPASDDAAHPISPGNFQSPNPAAPVGSGLRPHPPRPARCGRALVVVSPQATGQTNIAYGGRDTRAVRHDAPRPLHLHPPSEAFHVAHMRSEAVQACHRRFSVFRSHRLRPALQQSFPRAIAPAMPPPSSHPLPAMPTDAPGNFVPSAQ